MMNINKRNLEPEELSGLMAHFYNFLPSRMLQPTYQQVVATLPLKNEGLLLDIGAGPGNLAQLIAQKYPNLKVIGIDLSETMIKIANKKHKNFSNLEFKVMDGNNLEFEDNSIDYIISTLTLHHWKNPLKVLNEIHRVLKTGGKAWVYDGYSNTSDEDIDTSLHYPLGIKIPKSFIRKVFSWHGFSKKEYENYVKPLIEKSNFKKANFRQEGITMKMTLTKI